MSHFKKIVKKVTMMVQLTKIENPEDESGIPENELIKTENEEGDKFYNGYKLLDYLGEGAFSKVKLVEKNNQKYAMKVINRKKLMSQKKGFGFKLNGDKVTIDNALEDAMREIAILKKCNHKNVIKLYEILHDNKKDKLYLILEYVQNGTIMIYNEDEDTFQINEHFYKNNDPNSDYTEDEIRKIIRQIILGIDYLHNNGVIHRDIKPDNILISSNGILKLTDFDLCTEIPKNKNEPLSRNVITLYYKPPEIFYGDLYYGKGVDIWSIGCVFCELILGYPIFKGKCELETLGKIIEIVGAPTEKNWPGVSQLQNYLPYPEKNGILEQVFNDKISSQGLDLILKLLCLDPSQRISCEDALNLEYFSDACDENELVQELNLE
jgi:serine/threonine protein kinase